MAHVLIPADRVLIAVERATEALKPEPNTFRETWNREKDVLAELRDAATWSWDQGNALHHVALSPEERWLIEPYLPDDRSAGGAAEDRANGPAPPKVKPRRRTGG